MRRAPASGRDREPIATPNNKAKAKVAPSAPAISTSELTTPLRNSDQAGAVFNIGSTSSIPVMPGEPGFEALDTAGEWVGCSSAFSARQDAGRVATAGVGVAFGPRPKPSARRRQEYGCRYGWHERRQGTRRYDEKSWLIRSSARAIFRCRSARRPSPRASGQNRISRKTARQSRVSEVIAKKLSSCAASVQVSSPSRSGKGCRLIEQHQPGAARHQFRIRSVADGHADGPAANVFPIGDREIARPDQDRLRR